MIDSPWQTSSFTQYKTDSIVSEIMFAASSGRGVVNEGDRVSIITPFAEKMDTFNLPITLHELGDRVRNKESARVYIDGRSFMRKDPKMPGASIVSDQTRYDFLVRLAELTSYWVNNPDTRLDMMRSGDLPATVFISWVSYASANKLGLDAEAARTLQILTGIYYAHLYHAPEEVLTERGKAKVAQLVIRWTRHPAEMVLQVANEVGYMGNLFDYTSEMRKLFTSSTRIQQVNVGFLVTALKGSWFGFGATDVVVASLEYPPIFLALIEAAANSRVWKKSQLGSLVERFAKGDSGPAFTRSLDILLSTAAKVTTSGRRFSMEDNVKLAATDEQIAAAEKALDLTFDDDYVAFLQTHGVGQWGHHEIAGLNGPDYLDVVKLSQEFKKQLKAGRYVIENVGVDSVVIVSDAMGKLYTSAPGSEKPMNLTFAQYLKDVIAGKR